VIAAGGAGCHGEVVGKPGSNCPTGPHLRWLTNYSAIDVHPSWVYTTGSAMADVGRGGAVIVVKTRYRSRGLCTCGWAAKPRLLVSSAKVEALIHAARHDCEPAVPLIQRGVMTITKRHGILDVDCRKGARGQPPQVDQRRALLRAPLRRSSNGRRDRAVPHSTANLVKLIDVRVTGDLLQLTETHFTEYLLQLTDTHFAGNAIACGPRVPASRLGRYRMGYSPPRASSDGRGS